MAVGPSDPQDIRVRELGNANAGCEVLESGVVKA
jgi:hypothetical protein